jgi:hypothetical protein
MKSFKLYLLLLLLLNGLYVFSQEKVVDTIALPYLQKAEFNFLGIGFNYEIPVSEDFSLDSGAGFTAGTEIINNKIKFKYKENIFNPSFYIKSELKYYYNRYVRIAKKLNTRNGEGSYFAIQNKFITQRLFDAKSKLGNVILYEFHWGIQRNLYPDFLVNFHIGIGHSYDFSSKGNTFYTAIGVKVAYVFSTNKITKTSFDKFKF